MRKLSIFPIFLLLSLASVAQNLPSMGTDFWTGFAYHARMSNNDNGVNGAYLSLYIAAGAKAATVRVSLPGIAGPGFPRTVSVPANTTVEVTNFPRGDVNNDPFNLANLPDSRLYFTGITSRGIHIESTNGAPIAVYEHTYGRDAAGATLLFPSNTWGASYNVLTIGGSSNSGIPNAFFFVMAAEDNTLVDIVPSADIADSSRFSIFRDNGNVTKYPKGVPFTIRLNKGEIFNAMGTVVNKVASDLTGTFIKSQDCVNKKIMVMAGNGRTFVNTNGCNVSSGSDNLLQQMLPRVAWGTKYVTTPTKTMEFATYRVCVQDPATNVTVNGAPITAAPFNATLTGNFYYEIETNAFLNVESDKPIMVVQYIITGGCKNASVGNNGAGDPEMIILSPVQQAIKSVSVYAASRQSINTGASYINVVIPKSGVASFKIDNKATVDTGNSSYGGTVYGSSALIPLASAFRPHPADANYSFARFKVASGQSHSLSSDTGFNAIAYGLATGESYGYNAGTLIKDLTAVVYTTNPYATFKGPVTCPNNAARIEIALPYNRSNITGFQWDPGSVPAGIVAPATISTANESSSWVRSYTEGANVYNVYRAPVSYSFSKEGTYRLYVTVTGTFLSECGGTQVIPIDMEVVRDTVDFRITPDGCGSTAVLFKDTSLAAEGSIIGSWAWDFGDGTSSTVQNPPKHNYTALGMYNVKLSTYNSYGCVCDTVKSIDLSSGLLSTFSMSADSICPSGQITFTSNATSAGAAGNITNYNWTLKQIVPAVPGVTKTGATFTQTFYNEGLYEISHQVKTDAGCTSAVVKDTIIVMPVPIPDFDLPAAICAPGNTTFKNKTTIADNTINSVTYLWYFGDGTPKTNDKDGLHTYTAAPPAVPGYYNVSLIATSFFGCASNAKLKQFNEVYAPPLAKFTAPAGLCPASIGNFLDASTIPANQVAASYSWSFGDSQSGTGSPVTHAYNGAGTYPVKLTVTTDKGCKDDTTINVLITPSPIMNFSWSANTCVNNLVSFTDNSTGTGGISKWSWDFGDGTTSNLQHPQHTYSTTGTKKVRLEVETASGCKNAPGTKNLLVHPSPVADFLMPAAVCLPATTSFANKTTISDGSLSSVTYVWDYDDNGNTSTALNGSYNYTSPIPGGYQVKLSATSASGCQHDTVKTFVNLFEPPIADFTVGPTPVCENVPATFTDISQVTGNQVVTKWDWNFGDGSSASGYPMTHSFPKPGSFATVLAVVTDKGCASKTSLPQWVTINHVPVIDYTIIPSQLCLGDSMLFSDHSIGVISPIHTRLWEFGDGSSGTAGNLWHNYANAGNYNVKLTVTNDSGCVATLTKPVRVIAKPTVVLPDDIWVKQGSSVTLVPNITNAGNVNLSYAWTPPAYLNDSKIKTPVSTPRADQVYVLTVTAEGACSASDSIAVNLLKLLNPPNAFSPNADGINDVWNIPNLMYYAGNKVEVFDRYGRIVWKSDGYHKPWDGTSNGYPLPVGVYYYLIDPKNGFEKITGAVTIVR